MTNRKHSQLNAPPILAPSLHGATSLVIFETLDFSCVSSHMMSRRKLNRHASTAHTIHGIPLTHTLWKNCLGMLRSWSIMAIFFRFHACFQLKTNQNMPNMVLRWTPLVTPLPVNTPLAPQLPIAHTCQYHPFAFLSPTKLWWQMIADPCWESSFRC